MAQEAREDAPGATNGGFGMAVYEGKGGVGPWGAERGVYPNARIIERVASA